MKSEVFEIKRTSKTAVGLLEGTGAERSEVEVPGRSPTAAPTPPSSSPPDPEVSARPVRRRLTPAYKLRILNEVDAAEPGQMGAVLRREGLYSSYLTTWRRQKERGELNGSTAKKRGPLPKTDEPTRRKVAQLEKENSRLARQLKRAEQIIEVQKKIAELLGSPLSSSQSTEVD